ncbi:MAG TPA: 50S ribosomal protein L22 [Actinomycetota bacterium]|jgi:large subunit ribosomal protein L22
MATRIAPDAQEALASASFVRISPTKARLVVNLIRGRHVDDARRVLKFTQRAAAAPIAKVLESAIANAEHNRGLPGDELVVARAWIDEGPTLKRFRPRALGRATRIRKRTCHISIVVGRSEDTIAELPERPASKQTTKRARKTTAGKEGAETAASTATEASPDKTSKKKTASKKTSAKKTGAKSTAKKSTARKTTRKKDE